MITMKNSDINAGAIQIPANIADKIPTEKTQQQRVMIVAALMAAGISEAAAVQMIFDGDRSRH
jgi:uncharacterized protein YoaH (UPF0181 family)